jgi:tetratricopeptide (TPR) repeat protein
MKKIKLFSTRNFFGIIYLIIMLSPKINAQTEQENILKVVRTETQAYYNADAKKWASTWFNDSKISQTFISKSGYSNNISWDSIVPPMLKYLKTFKPIQVVEKYENMSIRLADKLAFVEYDQVETTPTTNANYRRISHEYRALVKENNEWKIATQITADPETYASTSRNIERDLNVAGYNLIKAKNITEAIELFKLNVRLNPKSWNVYDSLGEAYAVAGDKKLAIENYEKSLELKPDNKAGLLALEKLKKE